MVDAQELFTRFELGLTDAHEEEALAALLRDPTARRAFHRHACIGAALAQTPAEPARLRRKSPSRRPPRMWTTAAWATAALLLVGITAGLSGKRWPSERQPAVAHLEAVSGEVSVRSAAGELQHAANGLVLFTGDTIDTALSGTVTLQFVGEQTHLALAPQSQVRWLPPRPDAVRQLDLTRGSLQAEVEHRAPQTSLIITTPDAQADIVGTVFSLAATTHGTRMMVYHGGVRFARRESPARETLTITSGQAAVADEGLLSTAPADERSASEPLPAGSRVRWQGTLADGWYGARDSAAMIRAIALGEVDPWTTSVVRSPLERPLLTVAPETYLRFRYFANGFADGESLSVKLKPDDGGNFCTTIDVQAANIWHTVTVRVDGGFPHLRLKRPIESGEQIHQVVWSAHRASANASSTARFWISEPLFFTTPDGATK